MGVNATIFNSGRASALQDVEKILNDLASDEAFGYIPDALSVLGEIEEKIEELMEEDKNKSLEDSNSQSNTREEK